MTNDEELMSAEEFFGLADEDSPRRRGTARTSSRDAKRKDKDIFADVKVKMVMRIYGVSRAKALEIIAKRVAAGQNAEKSAARDRSSSCDGRVMTAKEFFGEVIDG
jgi:hypothetical protein